MDIITGINFLKSHHSLLGKSVTLTSCRIQANSRFGICCMKGWTLVTVMNNLTLVSGKQLMNVSNTHCSEHRSVCTQAQIEQKKKEALERRKRRFALHKPLHPNNKRWFWGNLKCPSNYPSSLGSLRTKNAIVRLHIFNHLLVILTFGHCSQTILLHFSFAP